jgi:flagellum-specific peptidoglycan hydrolase FlgJ
MSQPNYIQIGQVERQQDIHKDWQLVIDNTKIKTFFVKNWLNVVILILTFYIFANRNVYFSLNDVAESQNGKAAQVALKQNNIKQKVKNKTTAAIGEALQSTHDLNDYQVIGGTEGVVELLPQRNVSSKPVETSTAYAKGGTEANLFDNVSIFIAPEKANPVVVKSKQEKCWDYIRRFINVAKAERQKFGIPVSITLAQGLLESDAGQSRLTQKANNHFGVKTFNSKVPHVVMKDDTPTDRFKKYDSAWESFRDHSLLLMRDHYKQLQYLSKTDYVGWAKGLEKAGYATDKQYAENLIKIIENLKLYQFDEA